MSKKNRLSIDIGGTFTDVVLDADGVTTSLKVLTTHDAPAEAATTGMMQMLAQAGLNAADLDLVIHGTTLATNALIERKGARTALITTHGFRDSLEMAYEHRFEQYDLYMQRPAPLVPRDLRLEVDERVAADGSVLVPLDEASVLALVPLLRKHRIESVGVSLLHSYRNSDHERRIHDLLGEAVPELAVTLSCEVCPEIREYERTSTTLANAYVLPLMGVYLNDMQERLRTAGATCPLLLMMSSGGVTTVEIARRFPVRLVESGPAGGAILAQQLARRFGYDRVIAFDMGGTTAKLTLLDDFAAQQSREFEIARAYRFQRGSGLPVRIPVIDLVEIGAGGGSIARVDPLKRIHVGPDSAGSFPGPACYGRGGSEPTVTDADVAMGRVDPRRFAGGKVPLHPGRAAHAVADKIAAPLGLAVDEAAYGIAEMVDEAMASAARIHAVENGKDIAERTMIAFGGAAPLHAARMAQKLGIRRILVPVGAGVGSAHGFLMAPFAYEVVRTWLVRADQVSASEVSGLFAEMRAEAEAAVRLGMPAGALKELRSAYMRYRGQGHEIAVSLPSGDITPQVLHDTFDQAYAVRYGRLIPELEVEIVTWMFSVVEDLPVPADMPDVPLAEADAPTETRRIVEVGGDGIAVEAAIYSRQALPPGATLPGPAIIAEDGTSTIVPSGFGARIAPLGEIVIEELAP